MNKPFVKVATGGSIGGGGGGSSGGDTASSSDLPPRPLALSSPPEPIVRTGYGGDDGSDNDVNSNEERKQNDCGGGNTMSIIDREDELLLVDVEKKELQVVSTPSTTTKGPFVSQQSAKIQDVTGIKDESGKVSGCMKSHPSNDDDDDGDWTKTKKIINRQTNNRKMMAMMMMMQNNHQVSSSLTSSSSSLLSPSSTEHRYSRTDTDTTSNATFGTSHQSSGTTISSAVDIAVQTKHEEDEQVYDDAVVDVEVAAGADSATAGNKEPDDLPQDEIIALAPLPPLSGTKRRHRPARYRSSSDGHESPSSPPPFSPSSSYGITNPHRRYHRRNSILRHLDGFGAAGGGVGGSQDDMLMAAMIAAREVSDQSQYQHGSVLNRKHRRTNSSDVVLTGTPPSLSHRFSFSRNHHTNYHHPIVSSSPHALQAEDMVTRPPTSPTMTRRTMMMPPPPPFTSSTNDDVPSNEDTSTTTKATASKPGKESKSAFQRVDAIKDEAGARDQLEQPSVDNDGVAMEISDHLRSMGIIDGTEEGKNEEEHAGGEEEGGNGSNSKATTTRRRNFYSSWSDSDDTKWYMEMDENDQNNNAR